MLACATGSPASRRLTNETPLTTRPSLTSRQAIIRLASIINLPCDLYRVCQPDRARVKRLANDHALDAVRFDGLQRAHVVQRRDAPGGDDLQAAAERQFARRADVDAGQRAITRDVRKHRPAHAKR